MPPTSKKLEGHIAFGAFVHLFVHWSRFLMHSITLEPCIQDYAPFLSYGPLKKYGCNLVSKISQKLFKLEP